MNNVVEERNANQEVISRLKDMILKHLEGIKDLEKKIKEGNQMVNDTLTGNSAYHAADESAREVLKKKLTVKRQIMSTPQMVSLAVKMKDMRQERKERKSSLSDYLLEYERLSGANVIDTPRGEQLSIFKEAKAVRT